MSPLISPAMTPSIDFTGLNLNLNGDFSPLSSPALKPMDSLNANPPISLPMLSPSALGPNPILSHPISFVDLDSPALLPHSYNGQFSPALEPTPGMNYRYVRSPVYPSLSNRPRSTRASMIEPSYTLPSTTSSLARTSSQPNHRNRTAAKASVSPYLVPTRRASYPKHPVHPAPTVDPGKASKNIPTPPGSTSISPQHTCTENKRFDDFHSFLSLPNQATTLDLNNNPSSSTTGTASKPATPAQLMSLSNNLQLYKTVPDSGEVYSRDVYLESSDFKLSAE